MTIGIDCIALPPNFSGAAYYILNLVRGLLKQERDFKIQLFCKEQHVGLFTDFVREGDQIIPFAIKNRFQQLFFYEYILHKYLLKNKTDIFLATHYITPKTNPAYKLVTIFHDMGFVLHPEYYPKIKRLYFNKMIPVFIKRANKIVTVSKSTLNDLTQLFPECKSKTVCIYPGTDHLKKTDKGVNHQKNIKPFILSINSFEKRKNIPLILKIFSELKTKYDIPHQLYLVGQQDGNSEKLEGLINNLGINGQVKIFTDVATETLKKLYVEASLFISTSQYEGFGFTPFEAIKSGLPAFLFKNAVCKEFFGDHPYLLDSTQPDHWAGLIYSEMQSGFPNAINESSFKDLTWKNTSRSFLDLFTGM